MTMCGEIRGKWQRTVTPRMVSSAGSLGTERGEDKNSIAIKPEQVKISLFHPDTNQQGKRTKQKESLESLAQQLELREELCLLFRKNSGRGLDNLDSMPSCFDQALLAVWGNHMEWGLFYFSWFGGVAAVCLVLSQLTQQEQKRKSTFS